MCVVSAAIPTVKLLQYSYCSNPSTHPRSKPLLLHLGPTAPLRFARRGLGAAERDSLGALLGPPVGFHLRNRRTCASVSMRTGAGAAANARAAARTRGGKGAGVEGDLFGLAVRAVVRAKVTLEKRLSLPL